MTNGAIEGHGYEIRLTHWLSLNHFKIILIPTWLKVVMSEPVNSAITSLIYPFDSFRPVRWKMKSMKSEYNSIHIVISQSRRCRGMLCVVLNLNFPWGKMKNIHLPNCPPFYFSKLKLDSYLKWSRYGNKRSRATSSFPKQVASA